MQVINQVGINVSSTSLAVCIGRHADRTGTYWIDLGRIVIRKLLRCIWAMPRYDQDFA